MSTEVPAPAPGAQAAPEVTSEAVPVATTATNKIVILGGSYGGLSTAHSVLKHVIPKLPEKETYQVVVVSASDKAFCRPSCPRALISDDFFDQNKLFVSITKQFEQYPKDSFSFVHGRATQLDHASRTVSVDVSGETQKIEYHALVIATGASTHSPLFGLNQDVATLRKSWEDFRNALPDAKSIVIAGGGPTGVETAGELGEYLNGRAGFFQSKLENPKVAITLVTSEANILPELPARQQAKAESLLGKVGVTVIKNTRITAVEPAEAGTTNLGSKASLTTKDGKTMKADLYIPAVGTTPNTSFIAKELLAADGRVESSSSTFRVEKAGARVYSIGDAGSHARAAIHVVFNSVPVLTANIKRDLLLAAGKEGSAVGGDRIFKEDMRTTQLVPIGNGRAVGMAMGWNLPSFMIWLIKGRDYWLWTTPNLWNGKQWAKEG
jgi:apoptosis-inducing factor 2